MSRSECGKIPPTGCMEVPLNAAALTGCLECPPSAAWPHWLEVGGATFCCSRRQHSRTAQYPVGLGAIQSVHCGSRRSMQLVTGAVTLFDEFGWLLWTRLCASCVSVSWYRGGAASAVTGAAAVLVAAGCMACRLCWLCHATRVTATFACQC
eukprot:GHRQ01031519.1.p1 GENE.GHRQ01031519.1~~GHRQ01031519.1.p1  ORF type:complete len:152 (+),score=5.66 GHRQ01031519.1:199-654(+)